MAKPEQKKNIFNFAKQCLCSLEAVFACFAKELMLSHRSVCCAEMEMKTAAD